MYGAALRGNGNMPAAQHMQSLLVLYYTLLQTPALQKMFLKDNSRRADTVHRAAQPPDISSEKKT